MVSSFQLVLVSALVCFVLGPTTVLSVTPPPMLESDAAWPPPFRTLSSSACSVALTGLHKTYNAGPGQTYTELTDVPWLSLQAGDVVNIYYRAEPYRTKFLLRPQGNATHPVYINGVTDAACNRPILSGQNAVPATDQLNYPVDAGDPKAGESIETFTLIGIWKLPSDPYGTYVPAYITIQNLRLTQAHPSYQYTTLAGKKANWDDFSCAIYAVFINHLTVENCELNDNGLGIFTNSRGQEELDFSSYVILRRNYIWGNGIVNAGTEHGAYIQGRRVLFEGNYFGSLRVGAQGSSLKDRSSGTVMRFNKVIASARAIDLVESEEDPLPCLESDPLYNYAWLYGNIIINDCSSAFGCAERTIHWGFDNTAARQRHGTLFFYGNTFYQHSTLQQSYSTSIFQLGNDGDTENSNMTNVEYSGNVIWNDPGETYWLFMTNHYYNGLLKFVGWNYIPASWNTLDPYYIENGTVLQNYNQKTGKWTPTNIQRITGGQYTTLRGDTPKLDMTTWKPQTGSPLLGKGIAGPSYFPTGVTAANLKVEGEFSEPIGIVARAGTQDIGAREFSTALPSSTGTSSTADSSTSSSAVGGLSSTGGTSSSTGDVNSSNRHTANLLLLTLLLSMLKISYLF